MFFSSKQPILCDIDYLENGAFSDLVTLIVDFFHQLKVDLQLSVQKFSRNWGFLELRSRRFKLF